MKRNLDMGTIKILCLIGIVLLSFADARRHDARARLRNIHQHALFRSHTAAHHAGVRTFKRQSPVNRIEEPAAVKLPSFAVFQEGTVEDQTTFEVVTGCNVFATKIGSLYQLRAIPADCVNLAILLEKVLPEGKVNFESTSFMTLEQIIIRSISLDTATKGVEIAAAYNGTATLIKDILTISNIRVAVAFVWTRSQKFTFDIGATFNVGEVPIDLRLIRNEEGYYLTAEATANFNATTIRNMFKKEDTFLPSSCLEGQLKKASFNTFTLINPRLRATFADGYGFLFAGSIRILDWDPFDVNVLINKPNDSPTIVTIAVYTQSFSIYKMFLDLFEIDLTGVPVLGTVLVRNLALSLSTGDVEVPLTVLDIGTEAIFDIPYRKGLKVSFEIEIDSVYVATSIFISPTVISLTTSQNGDLTLARVINAFIPSAGLTTEDEDETTLNGWPSFIDFNPLDIALVRFHMETSKTGSGWALSNMNMKLKKEHEITLFSELIHISNLEFDLNYKRVGSEGKTSGLILGRVALGVKDSVTGVAVSPMVDIRIPFPFANEEISFTFTNFSVKSVIQAIATGYEFPDDFPELLEHIELNKIAIRFDDAGDVSNVSVDAGIPGIWRIFGKFSIGNVGIHFEYGKNQVETDGVKSDKSWRLKVRGEILISTCNITVTAEIGTELVALNVNGSRCSASVGDLLEMIHLNGKILPPIIAGFTIFNPRLDFKWKRTDGAKSIAFAAETSLFHQSEVELAFIRSGGDNGETAIVAAFAIQENALSELEFLKPLGLTDLAIVYVSKKIPITPYVFQNTVFNKYIESPPEIEGVTIYAGFTPREDSVLGKMLVEGVSQDDDVPPTIVCKIHFPKFYFELDINIPAGIEIAGGWRFTEMKFIVSTSMIGLSLKARVTLDEEESIFEGDLTLSFSGTVTISLLWEGTWRNPFGISDHLTINRMGLALGINIDLVPSFGITGNITVRIPSGDPIEVDLTLCIDPSTPQNTVFELHFTRLLLQDIINLFANSNVELPDKLANVGFPDEVELYFSPEGNPSCFGKSYDPGVEIHGTLAIPFLNIRARIDLSITFPPKFKLNASLVLDPVIYLNGLIKIVDADSDTKGAHLKMYITEDIADLKIDGSCRIEIFGAMISVNLKIDSTRFFFEGRLNLWNLFQVYILVDIQMTGSHDVHVVGEMQNDLFAKLKQKASQAIQSGAKAINKDIEAASQKILNAEHEVDKLQGYIDYHNREIANARHDCSRAPWYKKIWVCIGTGLRIVYHGAIVATLWIAHGVAIGVLEAARYFLKGVQVLIKVGADILTALVNAALSIIDIQYVKFDLVMNGVRKEFTFDARIVILGWTFTPHFTIDFSSSSSANAGISSAGQSISDDTLKQVKK